MKKSYIISLRNNKEREIEINELSNRIIINNYSIYEMIEDIKIYQSNKIFEKFLSMNKNIISSKMIDDNLNEMIELMIEDLLIEIKDERFFNRDIIYLN